MKTTISDLSSDLVEEILSTVPLKSIRGVRLSCKEWNTLSKSEFFTKMHMVNAIATRQGESQMIMVMDYNLYLTSVFIDNYIDDQPCTKFKGKLTCLDKQVKVSQVFHCEGLLLCILKDDTKLVVWNPYCGQTRLIKPRYSYRETNGPDRYMYALGYEKNKFCRRHKILRFIDGRIGLSRSEDQVSWYEIYDFDSDLWTTLCFNPHWRIAFDQRGVSLKGNTYWCATHRYSNNEFDDHIICFDFTTEKFGPLLHIPFTAGFNDYVSLSCVREEKLALLRQDEDNSHKLDIWVTSMIETDKVLWSKFLNVDTLTIDKNIFSPLYGSFLIDEENKMAMCCDTDFKIIGEDGYYRKFGLGKSGDRECRPHVCSYVPSLVQIKPTKGVKRKRESNLEKSRFDLKVLRLIEIEKEMEDNMQEGRQKDRSMRSSQILYHHTRL